MHPRLERGLYTPPSTNPGILTARGSTSGAAADGEDEACGEWLRQQRVRGRTIWIISASTGASVVLHLAQARGV